MDGELPELPPPSRTTLPVGARTGGFLITFGGILAAVVASTAGVFDGWGFTPTDWLFWCSTAGFCWYGVWPVCTRSELRTRLWTAFRSRPLAMAAAGYLVVFVAVGLLAPVLLGAPQTRVARASQPPFGFTTPRYVVTNCLGALTDGGCRGTIHHPFGTNLQGQDMLAVAVRGARPSLQVAVVVGGLVVPFAAAVGTTAAVLGGRVEDALLWYVDVQETLPAFLLYIVASFVLGPSLFLLVLVFGLTSWGGVARIVRSEVNRLQSEGFVEAATVSGATRPEVLVRHVVPNLAGTLVTATTQRIPTILLTEAAIAFLGLGDTGVPSWGLAISRGFGSLTGFLDTWWISTVPVVCLALTVVSITLVGDTLRDVFDVAR